MRKRASDSLTRAALGASHKAALFNFQHPHRESSSRQNWQRFRDSRRVLRFDPHETRERTARGSFWES